VPNNQWTLLVAPRQGWVPSWRNPMLATVIILSVLFGCLVMATLVSRHLQLWLLKETKVRHWQGRCQTAATLTVACIQCWLASSGRVTTARLPPLTCIVDMLRALDSATGTTTLTIMIRPFWCVMQASNEALAAEKNRMDVLLARQYNLISCMAEQRGLNNNGRRGNSLEEKTLGEAG
jgi:hypothetical protein